MNTTPNVAGRINDAIADADRTRSWVARKAAIAVTTLNRKLDGGADFTVGEVQRVAFALHVPPASLFPPDFFEQAEKKPAA